MIKSTQVALGNVIIAKNHRGELVERRLVGGKFGSVTKYFTLDRNGNLKSNARKTIEEVLEGYEIMTIHDAEFDVNGKRFFELEAIEKFRKGMILQVIVDGDIEYRALVGGKQFDTKAWFTINPETGERTSKTTYNNLDELVSAYDVVGVLV